MIPGIRIAGFFTKGHFDMALKGSLDVSLGIQGTSMAQSKAQYNETQAQYWHSPNYNDSYNLTFYSRLSAWEDNIVGAYLTAICITAVIVNSMVIYTCLKHRNTLIMSDHYILNLAISDVLLPLSSFPLAISSSFKHGWIYGHIGCTIYGLLGFFFGLVSITTLTIMGVTRYISICRHHISVSSFAFTRNSIICAYIYAFVWAMVPLSGWGSYTVEAYGTSCTLQWNHNRSFITLMSLFCIITPSIIMVLSYGLILLKCRQSNRKCNRNRRGVNGANTSISKKESYLIKITFAMCWGFVFSWMPYAVVSMWAAYGDSSILPAGVIVTAVLLAKTSTVVNPVIYFLFSKKFRPMLTKSFNLPAIKLYVFGKSTDSCNSSPQNRLTNMGNTNPSPGVSSDDKILQETNNLIPIRTEHVNQQSSYRTNLCS